MSHDLQPEAPRAPIAEDCYCPRCDYNLRGLTSDRCPECGWQIDFVRPGAVLIAWERRREQGALKAFTRTALEAIRRPRFFARAAHAPVSYRHAQWFRWICVALAYGSVLAGAGLVHYMSPDLIPNAAQETDWWFVVLVGLCAGLALSAFSGAPTYLFHPRKAPLERQNRAVALAYYANAPLALSPLLAALAWLATLVVQPDNFSGKFLIVGFLIVLPALAILALCWRCWIVLAAHVLRGVRRPLAVALAAPLLWGLTTAVTLVLLPAVAYFLAIVYYSLLPVPLR